MGKKSKNKTKTKKKEHGGVDKAMARLEEERKAERSFQNMLTKRLQRRTPSLATRPCSHGSTNICRHVLQDYVMQLDHEIQAGNSTQAIQASIIQLALKLGRRLGHKVAGALILGELTDLVLLYRSPEEPFYVLLFMYGVVMSMGVLGSNSWGFAHGWGSAVAMRGMETEQSLVLFLHDRTPCGCLKGLLDQLRDSGPHKSSCSVCNKRMDYKKLKVCGGCHSQAYCSKVRFL